MPGAEDRESFDSLHHLYEFQRNVVLRTISEVMHDDPGVLLGHQNGLKDARHPEAAVDKDKVGGALVVPRRGHVGGPAGTPRSIGWPPPLPALAR